MTINQAFEDLIKHWKEYPKEFRDKHRHIKSRYPDVNTIAMRNALLEAGYKEDWKK
jgi:hypothetical protein